MCDKLIHDSIFVEYSRVHGTDPGFPSLTTLLRLETPMPGCLKPFSFELNWCHQITMSAFFHGFPIDKKRDTLSLTCSVMNVLPE